jgi:hypothetical protein
MLIWVSMNSALEIKEKLGFGGIPITGELR